jgi:putative hydrolase of the HAD superfamily
MICALLFDLDNTLYSEASGLETGVAQRMNQFIANMFDLPVPEAIKFRREHAKPYGTTLEWLMRERGFHVLRLMLNEIHLPKAVLTNAPLEHAQRVLKRLDIADCFTGVYDIRFNNLVGKPNPDAYLRVLRATGFSLKETLFVDDLPKYVKGYIDLGGQAVLKDEMNRFADFPCRRIKTVYEIAAVLEQLGLPV